MISIPLVEEKERKKVHDLLMNNHDLFRFLENFMREAEKYFPGHKELELDYDSNRLMIILYRNKISEYNWENENKFIKEWLCLNNKNINNVSLFVVYS